MTDHPVILTLNGGSSSIKFTLCNPPATPASRPLKQLGGSIERIGLPNSLLRQNSPGTPPAPIHASTHLQAATALIQWLERHSANSKIIAIGHRIVHGGLHLLEHQLITDSVLAQLKQTQPLDITHLPREIALIDTFRNRFPTLPQVACFDTAFHRSLPRPAQLLPIPRRYDAAGFRRFGFHGISYAYLMDELRRLAGSAADGRLILAHLGSGASMAAVHAGKPMDTTMAFTPTAGLVMGTRTGDIDPGLLVYLMRLENRTPEQMDELISQQSGLLGISETTSDMQDLLAARQKDIRAAEAVELFCYQAKKTIGAYAAAMGGLDTLVFSGGIGEHSAEIRAEICRGLSFLGLQIEDAQNASHQPIISAPQSPVTIRVIPTDEEIMIAMTVAQLIQPHQH